LAPAHRADRALDRAALDAVRAKFAADPARKMPPLIVVASHIDRLTPAREWSPPYNVDAPSSPKEHSIRGALDAIARDLLVPVETIVPMRLDTTPPYNLEILWLRLEALVEEAQRARWVRVLRDAMRDGGWRRSWRQLVGAGRLVRERGKPGHRQAGRRDRRAWRGARRSNRCRGRAPRHRRSSLDVVVRADLRDHRVERFRVARRRRGHPCAGLERSNALRGLSREREPIDEILPVHLRADELGRHIEGRIELRAGALRHGRDACAPVQSGPSDRDEVAFGQRFECGSIDARIEVGLQ